MNGRHTRSRARACTGKIRHPSRAEALAHIAGLVRAGAADNAYEPYRCPPRRGGCGGWHIGHRTHRSRKEITTR